MDIMVNYLKLIYGLKCDVLTRYDIVYGII